MIRIPNKDGKITDTDEANQELRLKRGNSQTVVETMPLRNWLLGHRNARLNVVSTIL